MNKIKTVLGFEYRGYIKSKPFIITTIIFVAIIILGSQLPHFFGAFENIGNMITGGENQKALVLISGNADDSGAENAGYDIDGICDGLNAVTGGMYQWEGAAADAAMSGGADSPEKLIAGDKYSVVMEYGGGTSYKLYGKGQDFTLPAIAATIDPYMTDTARAAKMAGMTPEQQAEVKDVLGTTVTGEVVTVGGGEAENNFWLAYVMLYVLFMTIILYSQFIVNSIISEKSSKTMELLVTSAKPIQLMFGKVFGVGFAAFTQIGALIIAAGIGFALSLDTWERSVPGFSDMLAQMNLSPALLVFFVLFFVIGYFLYAFISAAMGSTASRIEDAGSVSMLPSMLGTFSFVVSLVGMANIDAAFVKVLSFIPLFSPWIMFARLCMASATVTEAAIAVAILAATVIFFGWLAAKIYRVGVMMYGKPLKLREAVKAAMRA
ncbi:MAG: ABC transporter permease [Clostridiales Family XIII bacterium]|jgi:ABC-2 type transport system permease protein|nr:ABC transporter permease [Clostridiales Family XIII bacterium]